MGTSTQRIVAALAIASSVAALNGGVAAAQDGGPVLLPGIDVTGTRLIPGPGRGPSRQPGGGAGAPIEPGPGSGGAVTSGFVSGTNITGTSTTIITSAEIERSPAMTIQDLLAREPGIQV